MKRKWILMLAVCLAPASQRALADETASSALTYQGYLVDDVGVPYNELMDLKFSLWASDVSTNVSDQIGVTLTFEGANAVSVVNGLFTVSLDFGESAYYAALTYEPMARWIEISVRRHAGGGNYTRLLPRQRLGTTPYSQVSRRVQLGIQLITRMGNAGWHIINQGEGGAGIFGINNPQQLQDNPALRAFSDSPADALRASADGAGLALRALATSPTGQAGRFEVIDSRNGNDAVEIFTAGRGDALLATSTGGIGVHAIGAAGGTGLRAESSAGRALDIVGTSRFSATASFLGSTAFTVASTNIIENLNAERLGGQLGTFYQNAGNLTTGIIPDARLGGNVARLNVAQTFTQPNIFSLSDASSNPVIHIQRSGGGGSAALRVTTSEPSGRAAIFESLTSGTTAVVEVTSQAARDALRATAIGGSAIMGISSSGLAGEFVGNVHVTGNITKAYVPGGSNPAIPIAYGFVLAAGTLASGTPNVTVTYDTNNLAYAITIANETYAATDYVTVVTPQISGANPPRLTSTSSLSGDLLVRIYDLSGQRVQNSFQFVTYKP